ncbi:hypothetical protein HNV10_12250 [Winogradskyella litoriviva]|uniref:Lipoprotein n=1 Tax=Winogradskyella litoriviva TaxID=1220182 RepID=A0ABX2E7H1_9FLAO|nr:hypothetical protein [Winogradskyella litoriviva]NRD24022.1 hypothetical protein [Winogradskyella litoriviva]
MNSKTPLSFCKIDTVKPLIIALSLTMIMGCKSYEPTNELKSIFVEDEIKDLETIRSFFIKDIMQLNDDNFHFKFRNEMYKLESSGFSSIKPKKIDELFKTVNEDTFNEIWESKTHKPSKRNSASYEYLIPKEKGKYLQFLAKNTRYNSRINDYYNKTVKSGNFSHFSMLNYLNDNKLDFDLSNKNIQIVLAIHYISICHDNNITSN